VSKFDKQGEVMIQPQPAQRGPIGEQHGLAKLTSTLDALTQGQTAQQQRDNHIQEQLSTQTATVTQLYSWLRWQFYALGGLAVLTLVLVGLVGWQLTHRPDMAYARALGALDQAVAQQWSTLPKATQEAFSATYSRLGLVPPGQRPR
jgi:hypothetical protein